MMPKNRPPTHPGAQLARFLEDLGMTQLELSQKLGVTPQTVNTLIKGKRGMTARLAVQLGRVLKTTPELWMNLQVSRDLWFAIHEGSKQATAAQEDAR